MHFQTFKLHIFMDAQQTGQMLPAMTNAQLWQPVSFDDFQRKAKALAASTLVPQNYRENVADCMIAIELAGRLNISPFLVMQNLHIIGGRPSWSANYLIACLNTSNKFTALKFETKNDGEKAVTVYQDGKPVQIKIQNLKCRATATERATGETLTGSWVSVEMAYLEGWATKKGSKWRTMPEQMLSYRAASFFSRIYAPEITLGFHTVEELTDAQAETVEVQIVSTESKAKTKVDAVNAKIKERQKSQAADEVPFDEIKPDGFENAVDELYQTSDDII